MTQTRWSLLTVALCLASGVGCSNGVGSESLTGPTPIQNTSAPGVLTGDRTSSRAATPSETAVWASAHGWRATANGIVVEATESITNVSGVCPDAVITVRGVPVSLTGATTFTAPLACANLTADMTVKVTALLEFTAEGLVVTATNIAAASEEGGGDDGDDGESGTPGGGGKKARGEGVIGAITGSCPSLTLVITGTRVSTTGTTEYVNGTCESLRPGTKVVIDGELRPGGTAIAERIEVQQVPGRRVSGDGTVAQVSGSCPTLILSVRGVRVTTSDATTFTGGPCSAIGPGTHIDVTGDYDGTEVVASDVAIRPRH